MEEIILLLGSNKGNRIGYLSQAVQKISALSITPVLTSSLYESEPWGFETETWFLNMSVLITSDLTPQELIRVVLNIERELGRVRQPDSNGYESREIDIDIIFYGSRIIETPQLVIPHPKMHLRRFVLTPVSEIYPGFIHPLLSDRVEDILERCDDKSVVVKSCRAL
ncbi:MAG: 2-amino-4-hydroxy-6-hydroxymethyldihydropteridine diphosphokinase [Bacteroidales bacterium]|jgi:2-amino-4-hydroxy-6-hydroxymethyldihydropteridine diphosphokinase|nr:2-amino-4-hydroxy-6-hydroxymethyldihydropteridine diphosphokinase [Bacteroidales bacterium]MDD4058165.1 2-amino-4-hydroxy-6-hydroxymethyldihydropteridine diphosphokinase [Bacteroidales bacterium]